MISGELVQEQQSAFQSSDVLLWQKFGGDLAIEPDALPEPASNPKVNSFWSEFAQNSWIRADVLPGVFVARTEAALEAETIMEARMQHLRDGEFDQVPWTVDPLSSAARVIKAKKECGEKSTAYREAKESLDVDCQRLLAEAWSKDADSEYFAPLEQPFNAALNSFTYKNYSLDVMVRQGLSPMAEPEEKQYRVGEFVEERTYKAVRHAGALALKGATTPASDHGQARALTVTTISECADWAIEAYDRGERNDLGGYAPKKKKLKLRSVAIRPTVRYQEEFAMSGEYITHDVVVEALRRNSVIQQDQNPSKVEVRALQLVNMNGDGVLAFARLLDTVAGEVHDKTIFCGVEVDADHPRNYAAIPAEAATRQKKLKADAATLSDYLIRLEKDGTDHWAANALVRTFVTNLLLEKVKDDPVRAEIVFDQKTAQGIREYQALQARGDVLLAERLWQSVQAGAPAAGFCGAGSCGLASEKSTTDDAQKAIKLGLKATNGEIIRDTERKCPSCKEKTILYDSKGSKVCINCDKKDIKRE
ncbi:MAG TPA: hypothetical protein VF733_06335 [Candidatus Saccharimonadales bacterium]